MSRVILVVDDEQDILDSIKYGLERNGFEVETYDKPLKALAYFQPNKYEHIILDIRMPKMTGFDLYHEIKKKDASAQVSFMSALDVDPYVFTILLPEIGEKNFLKKPMAISKLVDMLDAKLICVEN